MSLSIYTYSNPYEINNEPYWDSIKNCAHFCVSQTMVNGFTQIYEELNNGQVTTIEELVKSLYPNWFDTKTYIEQYIMLTNILESVSPNVSQEEWKKAKQSLKFNRKDLLDSIRLLCEMGINYTELKTKKISEEQKYLVAALRKFQENKEQKSCLKNTFSEEEIEQCIRKALVSKDIRQNKPLKSIEKVDCDSIVIHGVHQFTPTILNAIEQIQKWKRVILLFNYQQQYKEVYQTWVDVYSCFDINIKGQFDNEFKPTSLNRLSYKGNLLADALAKLANERYESKNKELNSINIIEFDNVTEFAAYVARKFEKAKKKYEEGTEKKGETVLSCMEEQFYSANNSVNDILKVYFPEQFGERSFLTYPIGHFFIAVTNMWDAENGGIKIRNFDDIIECLYSGALPENITGALITTFNNTCNYFSRETEFEGIISYLRDLKEQKENIENGEVEEEQQLKRLNYYNVDTEEIEELIDALDKLNQITKIFYEDFEDEENNFRHFYEKIKTFIEQQVLPNVEDESEFQEIIERLLLRLEKEKIDADGSFDCLKDTMAYYLKQENKEIDSANWIVRDFQQIDGDVLEKKPEEKPDLIYHFACVSDSDMNAKKEELFSWPLDLEFFEKAYDPLDWKYQVYIKSKREFKHFKRYALIYGLEFNRCKFKISYVKNEDDRENEPYYLLKLLGIKPSKFEMDSDNTKNIEETYLLDVDMGINRTSFVKEDVYRKRICAYKFGLETIVEDGVKYKDRFLQSKYFEILLANRARKKLEKQIGTDDAINQILDMEIEELSRYFRFLNESELTDIKTNVRNSIKHQVLKDGRIRRFPEISLIDEEMMKKKEEFIYLHLENENKENVLLGKFNSLCKKEMDILSNELENEQYKCTVNLWCQWCADREICLEYYKSLIGK